MSSLVAFFFLDMAWYVSQKYLDMYPLAQVTYPPLKEDDRDDVPKEGLDLISDTYINAVSHHQYGKGVQAYLAATSYADTQIGRILDTLKSSPYKDNTIVVLVSDHGFHVGEKGHWQKGTLWEDGTNVLLMVDAPGVTDENRAIHTPVSLLDLYPTLMELVGMEIPAHVDGRSLVPLLKGIASRYEFPVLTAYQNHISVRTDRFRLIRYSDGGIELYASLDDPNEWNNLAERSEYQGVIAGLSDMLPEVHMLPYVNARLNADE
ncbi:MAG: sulfatase-like hydrolase/transferase [Spirulinaceae cyanobacterium RM2_2_10]|nr:sulfatase-like hydrolase/transferase [Spirulinaceae cyanobacterium RM2_2_10]